jgi:hypothetical protein
MPRKPAVEGEVYLVDKPAEPTNVIKMAPTKAMKARVRGKAEILNSLPETIPEDKVAIQVMPKRKYTRKPKEEVKNETVQPSPDVSEESEPEPPRPKRREKKQPVRRRYQSETSETSEYGSDSEDSSDDDSKINKYVRKVHKRSLALKEIDDRLRRLSNPYESRGLSIF